MYHPDAMLKIAHDREAELVREAEICGIPKKAEAGNPRMLKRVLVIAVALVTLAAVLELLIGVS